MTRDRMTAVLRRGVRGSTPGQQGGAVDLDVLLLARKLAIARLPPDVQQAIEGAPVQHLPPHQQPHQQQQPPAQGAKRAPLPVSEWDWRCSSKQIVASNDCEQMTAAFGCANGCR
jgi:hypothetical protein